MSKILIVDDDPACVSHLQRLLVKRGYEVAAAMDGLTAAQVATREKPDLILLDFFIPAADGRVLLDRFRASPATARTPVLVMTGGSMPDVMAALPDRGLKFIEKPFDLPLLERLIAEFLGPMTAPPLTPPSLPPLGPPVSLPPPPSDDFEPPAGDTLDLDA